MKSSTRGVTIAVAVAAGIAALVFFTRPTPQSDEPPVTHEPMKASDRVRARLEQLRTEHPGLGNTTGSTVHVRSGVQPQHTTNRLQEPGAEPAAAPEQLGSDTPQDIGGLLEEDPDDLPTMRKIALEDQDPDRRLSAVTMLGASENPEAIPVLAQALSDSDEEVRMAALQALSDFTDEPPVEAIENALNDPAPDIRFEALSVLADVGGERARTAIEKALNDPDEDVRNLAEGILDLEAVYEPTP